MRTVKKAVKRDETRETNEMDAHIGMRIRERRILLGLSQEKLAESIGVTFQQVQKYERGTNRVSASRLERVSKALDVPVSFFFEGYGSSGRKTPSYNVSDNDQENFELDHGVMKKKETLELVRLYYSIKEPAIRKDILKMVKNMAERSGKK